jgi:cytochrome d ubiquinol oxidase subunit II
MDPNWLQITWYALFMTLIAGYAILDGFDLGIGVLSLWSRSERERRIYMNAVGPVWDGNEVWLLTAGGALFAAFPPVYATVFSGFYLALILVLVGLIARAVSMEFRGKVESPVWKRFWERMFGIGSALPALLFGVAVGNVLRGLPLAENGEFAGRFIGLLNPFSLLVGALGLAIFLTHGALYLAVKTSGDLRQRMLQTAQRAWTGWVVLYVAAVIASFFDAPYLLERTLRNAWFWGGLIVFLGALLYLPLPIRSGRPLRALIASSLGVLALIGQAAAGLYPTLVPARNAPQLSLTIANSSSSQNSLQTMLIIALIGMPLVLGYTIYIYRAFKGEVELDEHSY